MVTFYPGESLHEYLEGGADLFLEYGIDTLMVVTLEMDGSPVLAEIYRMKDPDAAFGIFSVSRFRCSGGIRLTEYQCRSASQLMFSKGCYFVTIYNETGSMAEQQCSDRLASVIIGNIPGPLFDPSGYYGEGLDEETMRGALLVRGPVGVSYGIPSLTGMLETATGYSAMVIRRGRDIIASLRFNTAGAAQQFLSSRRRAAGRPGDVSLNRSAVSLFSPNHLIITF